MCVRGETWGLGDEKSQILDVDLQCVNYATFRHLLPFFR